MLVTVMGWLVWLAGRLCLTINEGRFVVYRVVECEAMSCGHLIMRSLSGRDIFDAGSSSR